jgi:mannitol-1-phosphate 5-dehydrogenase
MKRPGKTFVGFGFGPIQSGLFLYEAYLSGNFRRFVVAEIDEPIVRAIRRAGGRYSLNIARPDRIDQAHLDGIELYNPGDADGREKIIDAVAESEEMATALPSVAAYEAGGDASAVSLLAEGLSRRERPLPTILYAAENHNHAAEILLAGLTSRAGAAGTSGFQALNTVIGKMSGVITDAAAISRLGLATVTPGVGRAILIEEFNRILISRVTLPGCRRGIDVFQEKDDLLPFEEAKLYGHNAVHSLIAYLADLGGLTTMAQAGQDARIMAVARGAFLDESAPAMIRRNARTGDELFTPKGWRDYAEDLLERMVCRHLNDLVARVGRDHVRKLGYADRLFGTMRLAMDAGIEPANLALGAAAGVLSMIKRRGDLGQPAPAALPDTPQALTAETLRKLLMNIWGRDADSRADQLVDLTWRAAARLREGRW